MNDSDKNDSDKIELKKKLQKAAMSFDPFLPAEKVSPEILTLLTELRLEHLYPEHPYELTKQILMRLHNLDFKEESN